jgi:type I restriction enzyme S subunit
MAGEWRDFPFSAAVTVNPRVELKRGNEYPFVDMQAVDAGSRCAYAGEVRVFEGGGSRFAVGDTLMARITPCLENGKITRFCACNQEIVHMDLLSLL